MKIQCVLIRAGGTKADLDGIEYHFEPLVDGAHVADVTIEKHIDRFLSIPEAFKVYHGSETPEGKPVALEAKAASAPVVDERKPARLSGSSQHPAEFTIAGKTYAQIDVVRKAFEASGLSEDEWNELDEDERAAKLDIMLDALADEADAGNSEREQLVAAYVAKFGKKPNGKASVETLKAKLAE